MSLSERFNTLRLPVRASLWYMISGIIGKVTGILTTPIFTRLLSGEQYGTFTLYMSYLGLATVICSSSYPAGVIYKGLEEYSENKRSFLSGALGLSLCFTASICIVLFTLSPFLPLDSQLLVPLCLQLFVDSTTGICLAAARHTYDFRTVVGANIFSALATPAISIALILSGVNYQGRIFGLVVAGALVAVPLMLRLLRRSVKIFNRRVWGFISKRALPLLPYTCAGAVTATADKLMISAFMGVTSLAKYSVAHSIGAAAGFAVTALCSALHPWVTRKLGSGNHEVISQITAKLWYLVGSTALLPVIIAPEAMGFLSPPEYSAALAAVFPIALAALPTLYVTFSSFGTIHLDKASYATASAITIALSNILFGLLIIPRLGYSGAGLAILLSHLAGAAVSRICLKKCHSAQIMSDRSFLGAFIWLGALGLAAQILYPLLFARIILLIPVSLTLMRAAISAKELITEEPTRACGN